MAFSPGKQLPPGFGEAPPFSPITLKSTDKDEDDLAVPTWKLRDAANELLTRRPEMVGDTGGGGSSTTLAAPITAVSNFEQFDLERIYANKQAEILAAFQAAASTVLDAVQKQSLATKSTKYSDHDIEQNLPTEIADWENIERIRVASMERARDNKEYSKRGGNSGAGTTSNRGSARHVAVAVDEPKKVSSAASTSSAPPPPPAAAAAAPTEGPKFTRNTPASSAAALDFRFNSARAILCAAGNVTFEALTPSDLSHEIDVRDVPQNPANKSMATTTSNTDANKGPSSSSSSEVNMGAVVVEAQTVGQRAIAVAENAIRRCDLRLQYRKDNSSTINHNEDEGKDNDDNYYLKMENPFQYKEDDTSGSSSDDEMSDYEETAIPHQPNNDALTMHWQTQCLPRFLNVAKKGVGHAVYCDLQWGSRHGRVADFLRSLVVVEEDKNKSNFGPHLIVTTEPEVVRFAQEFYDMRDHLRLVTSKKSKKLISMVYQGSHSQRRKLRKHFPDAVGLPASPFHVLITSYSTFLQDYLHFCQLPFNSVVLDDGLAWMGAAQGDPNSAIGYIWESGIFSSNDKQIGLAASSYREWDFSSDEFGESILKEACIGLTARHRILTTCFFTLQSRYSTDSAPVSGLVNFIAPQFSDVVREEWDRSRISSDAASMKHFQRLVARSIVVHNITSSGVDMHELSMLALSGKLPVEDRYNEPQVPEIIPDDAFVSDGKVAFSRRSSLLWLGLPEHSWLRYEIGMANLKLILEYMKAAACHGFVCEEITTASSMTSSGATGHVAGSMAFRPAIRCGRHFGSEQGLRQHISAMHAPPGTWLCRTCGVDCVTSQMRTHHERSCGQPISSGDSQAGGAVGATPTVGQGAVLKGGVGKKKGGRPSATQQSSASVGEEKDSDGSFRVRGYRGVWVDVAGKHFVKINGKRVTQQDSEDVLYFDNIDDAARKHDELLKKQKKGSQKLELNFKPDGSRIVYEDITPASTSGVGGSASNVVPALSVINIKDLPPDVKPLLRDPRQTSRTGGNSKRHVYAYRGVCRQARKGHDRWQSQISFMGVNHYLGTFDSEWDAAAIYAWAHLILYGEEATKQAQKEGEEAAAAYEQEKRDIAAGKIPEPPPKPEKKKKKKEPRKKGEGKKGSGSGAETNDGKDDGESEAPEPETKKRKATNKDSHGNDKRPRTAEKSSKADKESLNPILSAAVFKAPILAPRDIYESTSDSELLDLVSLKITAAKSKGYCVGDVSGTVAPSDEIIRPCISSTNIDSNTVGIAMLVGLSSSAVGWDLQEFIEISQIHSTQESMTALQILAVEYDEDGTNEKFKCFMQGSLCVIGSASKKTIQMYKSLGLGTVPVGGSVAGLDCNVGGVPGNCSEAAACIRYLPSDDGDFQLSCLSQEDVVTLNGERLSPDMGALSLSYGDVCSVGARVFTFIPPL